MFVLLAAAAFAITVWACLGEQAASRGNAWSVAYGYGFPRCVFSFLVGRSDLGDAGRPAPLEGLAVSSVAVLAALFAVVDGAPAVAFAFPFLFAALIWAMARDTGPLASLLSGRFGLALGLRPYSAYMLHPVLLFVFWPVANRVSGALAATVVVLVYLGSAAADFWLGVPLLGGAGPALFQRGGRPARWVPRAAAVAD